MYTFKQIEQLVNNMKADDRFEYAEIDGVAGDDTVGVAYAREVRPGDEYTYVDETAREDDEALWVKGYAGTMDTKAETVAGQVWFELLDDGTYEDTDAEELDAVGEWL